ncbi:MAG: hypothetical protein ABSB63_05085 [Spirochaetia bacterium]|jgi:hypothetical protein
MKKKALFALVVVLLLCAGALNVSAQLRLDMSVSFPLYLGAYASGYESSGFNSYFIPFPEIQLAYQFGEGALHGGVGARTFTFIIENILYPAAFIEYAIDPIVLSLNVGGFAFLEFGLLSSVLEQNHIATLSGFHSVILPDFNVAYKVNDWFRLSAGMFIFAPFGSELGGYLSGFAFAGYLQARFIVVFD